MILDVAGAIETAAGADHPRLPEAAAARRAAAARGIIRRFLEHVPDEACALKLKRAIDEDAGDR